MVAVKLAARPWAAFHLAHAALQPLTGAVEQSGRAGGALEEEEVIQAIRLLTRFGEVGSDPNVQPEAVAERTHQD